MSRCFRPVSSGTMVKHFTQRLTPQHLIMIILLLDKRSTVSPMSTHNLACMGDSGVIHLDSTPTLTLTHIAQRMLCQRGRSSQRASNVSPTSFLPCHYGNSYEIAYRNLEANSLDTPSQRSLATLTLSCRGRSDTLVKSQSSHFGRSLFVDW